MTQALRARPTRDRLTVQQRHLRIVALRAINLSLTVIARDREVGLNSHTSVLHHLNGDCRCGLDLGRLEGCRHEFVTACKRCGTTKSRNGNGGIERPSGGDRV